MSDHAEKFVGWYRLGGTRGKWRLCCRGPTHEAVLRTLLNEAPRGSDKLVRDGDGDPNVESTSSRPRRFL